MSFFSSFTALFSFDLSEGMNELTRLQAGRFDSRQSQTVFLCYRASKPAMHVTVNVCQS